MSKDHTIRRSQLITTFGVGSICDLGEESFVAKSIDSWGEIGEIIRFSALEEEGITHFKIPPEASDNMDIPSRQRVPYFIFPQWLFCQKCRFFSQYFDNNDETSLRSCDECSEKALVPIRWILACERGHLGDIDWRYWCHSNSESNQCKSKKLKFEQIGKSSSFDSLWISCLECGSKKNLIHLHSDLPKMQRCSGKQPWQNPRDELVDQNCRGLKRVLQRGDSNVYFPHVISAIEVLSDEDFSAPVLSTLNYLQNNRMILSLLKDGSLTKDQVASNLSREFDISKEEAMTAILFELDMIPQEAEEDYSPLEAEWPILHSSTGVNQENFESEPLNINQFKCSDKEKELIKLLDNITLVRRLREVRVLKGFYRISPNPENLVEADLGKQIRWRPAVEVFGEGVFISLNQKEVNKWMKKNKNDIDRRLAPMLSHYQDSGGSLSFLPVPSVKLVLVHTLSHALIQQMVFETGYSSASLRERIYVSDSDSDTGMLGFMIYTSDSDSEGALGGLTRQGELENFIPLLRQSLESASWCSADPVCMETSGQGLYGLNRGACHVCALVSETSCIYSNVLLDRALLVGANEGQDRLTGLFEKVI